jgi:eukaryotic translation initiation factor 2C
VYRDGGSDGSFERILEKEVAAIREAICEVNRADKDLDRCPLGCQSKNLDCEHCEPPRITFVVAKNDHNMRIVPVKGCDQAFKNNVPSGTLVDGHITSYGDSEDTFDFLLTPQGGLKGTSKPMHFCVLANENALPPHGMENASALTKEKLYQITYHMAFQCKFSSEFRLLPLSPFSRSILL